MRTPNLRRTRAFTIMVVAVAGLAVGAPAASADLFGEITSWGTPGTPGSPAGPGQFMKPQAVAVDTSDHSVYALDLPGDETALRLQKFADPGSGPAGAAVATASIPRGASASFSAGMVVDPALHRVYVLEYQGSIDAVTGLRAATQIDAYSTQDTGGTLPSAGTLTLPDATDAGAIEAVDAPGALALDPVTHDLLVLGYDRDGNLVIQRVGSNGTLGARYVDAADSELRTQLPGGIYQQAVGLAVDPSNGDVYVALGFNGFPLYLVKLTSSFANPTVVVRSNEDPAGVAAREAWFTFGAIQTIQQQGTGTQLAFSPDGATLYWTEEIVAGSTTSSSAGNYVIRGFSPASARTVVVLGGNRRDPVDSSTPVPCEITTQGASIAPDRDGVVYAFDRGNYRRATPIFGAKITKFGPGGSGCPAPAAKFSMDGRTEDRVTFKKGDTVTFDATGSDLHGTTPSELAWDFDGSGTFRDVVTGSPAATTIDHRFLQVGTFRVSLRMAVDGSSFGQPPILTKTVTIQPGTPTAAFRASTSTPAAGATVTFDAGSSFDPTGSDTAGQTTRLRTYTWTFGDGTTQTTSSRTIDHAFANATSAVVRRSVRLVVTSFDGVDSLPNTQTIAVQGTSVVVPPPVRRDPPPPTIAPPGTATLSKAALRGTSAALTIGCAIVPGACDGKVTLVATLPAPRGRRGGRKAKAKATVVGSARFSLAAGAKSTVTVKLTRAARALLARSHRLKLTVSLETRNSLGRTSTTAKTATLVLPARRKARRGRR